MNHGTCIHFNGIQNDCCKCGISYHENWPYGPIPCIQFIHKSARGGTYLKPGEKPAETMPHPGAVNATPCQFYEEPTEDQVHAYRVDREEYMNRTAAAIKVAGAWRVRPKPAADRHEVVECPVCNGRLHLSQSAYNGHVHGKCETAGCVSWME